MLPRAFLFRNVITLLWTWATLASATDYHERLLLEPLPQSALLASFNFRSNTSAAAFEEQNFGYFPRSLGQILQHAHTKELHLRFSLGRWDAEAWGTRPWSGTREGGTGVELWAWVEADNDAAANARWLTLTNALSGLFCASLNFIDSTKTIKPVVTFQPEGNYPSGREGKLHLLHGTLPHEVVCTENLTPFLKLLPCKGKAGISSLLDGHKLFDASWQSMAIDIRPVCPEDGSDCLLEMEQTVDMVLDIDRSKRPRDNPIPRPLPIEEIECDPSKPYNAADSCYPLDRASESAWSLKDVFGHPIQGACPLGSSGEASEDVCLLVAPEREVYALTSVPHGSSIHDDGTLRCYKLPSAPFDISLPEQTLETIRPTLRPLLYASRSITGHGAERGGLSAVLTNPSPTNPISAIYLESLPWFMKPYLHTLQASISPSPNDISFNPIRETYYRPALDRHRGSHLELALIIPPASSLTLTYDFDKAILRYTEYPPDANRGFDVAPAVIRIPENSSSRGGEYLRTTSLLLPLPTPDFSMPYNVIILTSTVMALGFGSVFNLLVRRFVGAEEVEGTRVAGVLGILRGRVKEKLTRWKGKGRVVDGEKRGEGEGKPG